jgi:DNA-binding winged helix-turn-helix (wHTH) protein
MKRASEALASRRTLENPYVLGRPIKEPRDFYGRRRELREVFQAISTGQPVALVGEHRCGNTSLLHQISHPDPWSALADVPMDEHLVVFFNAQLAGPQPSGFLARLARTLRRKAPEISPDNGDANADQVDEFWVEDFLERLAPRRLVLLVDEFECLAGYPPEFWEWFRGLIHEYDIRIVVGTRIELGDYRSDWGIGSPFFNTFRSIYVGAFAASEVEGFLKDTSARSGVDLAPWRARIETLAGRLPYFIQLASWLFYGHIAASAQREGNLTPDFESLGAEFALRAREHYEAIWPRLSRQEQQVLSWLAVSPEQSPGEPGHAQTLARLERKGYVLDGVVPSSAFADFVRQRTPRIELDPQEGRARVEQRLAELAPKEYSLLRFLMERESQVVTKDEIAAAVWPEYDSQALGVTDAMIQKTMSRLREEICPDETLTGFKHIESIRGQGYRFQNASIYDVYRHPPVEEAARH